MQYPERKIHIDVAAQRLELREDGRVLKSFPVSTSVHGIGTEPGSFKTPPGRFRISEKIGGGAPLWAVFKSRIPTGETGSREDPEDLVLTRILWLDGIEEHNAGTRERYIYIHGTNHESRIGTPASHGCIRMRNEDMAELFDGVETGTEVVIRV